jgi:hypothetical protein
MAPWQQNLKAIAVRVVAHRAAGFFNAYRSTLNRALREESVTRDSRGRQRQRRRVFQCRRDAERCFTAGRFEARNVSAA